MKHFEFVKWLKAMVIIAAIFGLTLFAFVVPLLADETLQTYPEAAGMYWPCLIFVWLSAIPFAAMLIEAWKIFKNIDKDRSFCEENSLLLRNISVYAIIESIWYFTGATALSLMKMMSPGILIIFVVVIVIGFAVTVCTAALSRLVLKACKLQNDSDLTI